LSRWLASAGVATLDAILAQAPDVVGIMDPTLTIRYLNWTAPGLTRERLVGGSVLDLVPPAYREISQKAYLQVLETGEPTHFETLYRDERGILVWDVRVGPIRHAGAIIGLIVLTANVTEERSAHADRERFFSLSLDMLCVVSAERRFKRVNPAFGETLGHTTAELVGSAFIDLVHDGDRARTLEEFGRVIGGTPVTDFENRYRRRDGEYRVFSWRATSDPVTGDVYAVARDVTEHRATEAQLRRAQKMEAVGQLAGGIAHDFNNLLLAILANAELGFKETDSPAAIAEHLVEIESAARRAADLTKQLLTFSRRQLLRPTAVDLDALLRGLMKLLRRLLPESIVIELAERRALPTVSADPSQLEQVIVNLCVNARDAMEGRGTLRIETDEAALDARFCEAHAWAKPGRYARLAVTDNGAGMTPEVRERAFEPFFTTKPAHQGTGLGLSTVYGIVQQHEGLIHIHSEPGRGSRFEIYLPAVDGPAASPSVRPERVAPRGGETILLAEDEEQVRRALVRTLRAAGYRAIAVANGIEALEIVREGVEPVALVLLDVVMPGLGGPETWELMRPLAPDLRVLFMSGYADDSYRQRIPADAEVVDKPFRTQELLVRIRGKLDEVRGA
jgi:PAS domain S-box-containing protein